MAVMRPVPAGIEGPEPGVRTRANAWPARLLGAAGDLERGLRLWPLWTILGWYDIRMRYRRSMIGPFWITISTAVMVAVLGLVYGRIFHLEPAAFIPFVATGLVCWSFVANTIQEGANALIASESFVRQMPMPLSVFVLRAMFRNFVFFLHNFIIIIAVCLWFESRLDLYTLAFLPGILLVALNLFWMTLTLAILCARFRDVPLIVQNVMQVMFFATPVFYERRMLAGGLEWMADFNPFHHLLQAVRAPLLQVPGAAHHFAVLLAMALVGSAVALALLGRCRHRVAYWL